jgi:hypothetical protein
MSESGSKDGVYAPKQWKEYQKIAFRIAFIFFICISIPNSVEWYKFVVNIDWTNLHYRDLYDIARFGSGLNLFGNTIFGSNLSGYANWIITFLASAIGGAAWTFISKWRKSDPKEYNLLYYWLRVVVRYRAGIGIIGFGFTKLLPLQLPYPSEGILNTDFGDLTAQKIYWLSIGIVPWYEIFAGVVEVGAGALLFFRRTTLIGSVLLFGALADIVHVNFSYDGGVHVYSSYFVLLSAFLIVHYIPQLYRLLILEKTTLPVYYYPSLDKPWQKFTRIGLKTAVIGVFLVLFFYLQLVNFLYDPYKQPATKGITQLRGQYQVAEFRVNNQLIPYSSLDSVRWSEASFENWTTLSFKVNRPVPLDLSNGGGDPQRDINRTFELAGVGGGRRVFHYFADTVDNVLYLQDKYKAVPDRRNVTAGAGGDGGASQERIVEEDPRKKDGIYTDEWISKTALEHIGDENSKIDKRAASARRDREFAQSAGKYDKRNRMVLKYETTDGSKVFLKGVNETQDSIHIVLDRVERQYALSKSTLNAGTYE